MALVGKERSTYVQKPAIAGDERIIVNGTQYITPAQIAAPATAAVLAEATRAQQAEQELDNAKVDKVAGKGLSTNDYSDTEKGKVSSALQPDALSPYRTEADQDLIDDDIIGRTAALEGQVNKLVLSDMTASEDGSTVKLSLSKINIKTGATASVYVPLPVVDANGAGVLNPQTYQTIINNQTLINAIIGASVAVSGLAAEPTQQQVTTAWLTASGETSLINGARLFDVTNTKVWTYYTNTQLWYPVEAEGGGSVVIAQWTNTALGTVKGVADNASHTNDGKLTAETDGTGSVLGWDRLVARVQTIENAPAIQDTNYVHTDNNFDDAAKTKVNAAYQKPNTGIPAIDIASGVIPSQLSQLEDDVNHRTVTDVDISNWNDKQSAITEISGFSESKNQVLVNNNGVIKWMEYISVLTGTEAPVSSLGNDGDIYLQQ